MHILFSKVDWFAVNSGLPTCPQLVWFLAITWLFQMTEIGMIYCTIHN